MKGTIPGRNPDGTFFNTHIPYDTALDFHRSSERRMTLITGMFLMALLFGIAFFIGRII